MLVDRLALAYSEHTDWTNEQKQKSIYNEGKTEDEREKHHQMKRRMLYSVHRACIWYILKMNIRDFHTKCFCAKALDLAMCTR